MYGWLYIRNQPSSFYKNCVLNYVFFIISSAAQCALYQQNRGMANLKAIAIRLKSVKNIQKITQSMKMVSAAKYARAERDLKAARPYGTGAQVRKIQES